MADTQGEVVQSVLMPAETESDSRSFLASSGLVNLSLKGQGPEWHDHNFYFDIEFPSKPREAIVNLSLASIRNDSNAVNLGFKINGWSLSYRDNVVRVNGSASVRDIDGYILALSYFCIAR